MPVQFLVLGGGGIFGFFGRGSADDSDLFFLACSVHFVCRRLWAISTESAQIVQGQNEQSMRVKRSDPQKD